MSGKGKPGSGQQLIDLTKLNLMQLTQFKNQLDQDLQFYQESLQNLKHAQTKFSESGEAVKQIPTSSDSSDILVPLTGSMYVPGKLADPDKVLVDVGTGYYVEKKRDAAKEYFTKKVPCVCCFNRPVSIRFFTGQVRV